MQTLTENFFSSKRPLLREVFLYGVIGGSTASLDVLLFQLLYSAGATLFVANFISVNIAIATSFTLNAKYNFRKTDDLAKRASKFFSVGYFGLLISFALLWLGVEVMHLDELYVKVFSVLVAAAVQYLLNKFLTFRR